MNIFAWSSFGSCRQQSTPYRTTQNLKRAKPSCVFFITKIIITWCPFFSCLTYFREYHPPMFNINMAHQGETEKGSQQQIEFVPGVSRLAIDVGNVISRQNDTDDDDALQQRDARGDLSERLASSHPTEECAEACRLLVNLFGPENTFILSKCGSRVQLATVQFLKNKIKNNGPSFLERTGMLPRNIIFCTQRSGGSSPVRLIPLVKGQRNGPRVAAEPVGKGAVAATLSLTHLIDDRVDCLLSFFWEGHIWREFESFEKQVAKKKRSKKAKKQGDCVPAAAGLIHFGNATSSPSDEQIADGFLRSMQEKGLEKTKKLTPPQAGIQYCKKIWVNASDWEPLREALSSTSSK